MMFDQFFHKGDATRHRHVRETNQAGVGAVVTVDQLAEVLVHRDEHATLDVSSFENRAIAGVIA